MSRISPARSSHNNPHSRIAHSSQVDYTLHNADLMYILDIPVNWDLIDFIIDCVISTTSRVCIDTTFATRYSLKTAFFTNFVKNVVTKSGVGTAVLLVTLAYIDRAGRFMEPIPHQWACERLFLGALISASKYLNDVPFRTQSWAACTGIFTQRMVNRTEREFLVLLDYDLDVQDEDLLVYYDELVARCIRNPGYWDHLGHLSPLQNDPRPQSPPRQNDPWNQSPTLYSPDSEAHRSSIYYSPPRFSSPSYFRGHSMPSTPSDSPAIATPGGSPSYIPPAGTMEPYVVERHLRRYTRQRDSPFPPFRDIVAPATPDTRNLPPIRECIPPYLHYMISPCPAVGTPEQYNGWNL